jgi:hypothetical protein
MRLLPCRFAISSHIIAVALAGGIAGIAQAQFPTAERDANHTATSNRDESVLAILKNTIVDAAYDRIDLEKVFADLRERHNLNIHVSWTALEATGVRRDQRIELRLKQVSLATLLEIILREAAGGASGEISYHVADGVLIVSTGEASREETVLRAYEISDLLESGYALRRFANTPVLGLELTGREFVGGEERKTAGGGGGGSGGGSLFSGGGDSPERLSEMERVEMVVNLLQENIDPDSWRDAGGETGSIQVFNSTMLIRHTLRTHQRIAEFFALLRGSRPEPVNVDAAIVRVRSDKAAEMRKAVGEAFPRLNDEQAERLALASNEGVLFRGSTSGFNGQGLWFSALTQRDVLTGQMPVVAQGINAFSTISKELNSGLELIVLPLLTPQTDEMTLDVQMAWVPSTQTTQRAVALGAGVNEATIDQTMRSMRSVSSTTALKVGESIALSIPSQLSDNGAAMEWEDWLIVRVRKAGM